jgi:microcystin-dependent protein
MADPSKLKAIFPAQQAKLLGYGFTGEVKSGFWTTAPEGWLLLNGGTIGNASSAGSSRANNDCYDLFVLLWTNVSDTYCPVVTGRGASASADWYANKKLTLPDARGRVVMAQAASGTGAGMAETGGSKDFTVTLPAHYHGMGTGADLHIHASGSHSHAPGGGDTNFCDVNSGSQAFTMGAGAYATALRTATATATHTHANTDFDGVIGYKPADGSIDGNSQMTSGSNNQAYLVCNYIIAL